MMIPTLSRKKSIGSFMQILAVVALVFILMLFVLLAAALIISALVIMLMACLIGLPLWFVGRRWLKAHNPAHTPQRAIDRLRTLYADGKIDLFEFEHRVAKLVSHEH
jgi:predicted ABC-type exoprotein transport system permease subunit